MFAKVAQNSKCCSGTGCRSPPRFSPWGRGSAWDWVAVRSAPRASVGWGNRLPGGDEAPRLGSNSLVGAPGREASILAEQARASRDHAPRFLGSGNAAKARQRIHIRPRQARRKVLDAAPPKLITTIRQETDGNQSGIQRTAETACPGAADPCRPLRCRSGCRASAAASWTTLAHQGHDVQPAHVFSRRLSRRSCQRRATRWRNRPRAHPRC